MGKTRKAAGPTQPKNAAAKKARTLQQPGIAAAFAALGQRAAATESAPPPELWQNRPRDLVSAVLTQDLSKAGDQYLQHWGDKCFMARGQTAAAARAASSGTRVQRAATVAAESKEDADLDVAGLRYLDELHHVEQQATRAGVAFKPRSLELLALILRCDVLHKHGDVSYRAYTALQSMLRRFPYASIGCTESGPWAGRPFVIVDETAAWQPLEALTDPLSLTRRYMLEESIKDAGHNYRLDQLSSAQLLADRKKGGQLGSVVRLLKLCTERAADSVEQDHNGDVLLLAYLLALLQQDLRARLQVFEAYADVEDSKVLGLRFALLQNSLLWRVWMDQRESDQERADVVRVLMKLIVGVASEQELQEVEEQEGHSHHNDPDAEEQANPCICTPRQLAAMAATLLNMLLDCFSAAEAAGGFVKTRDNRMHRGNLRMLMDKQLKQLFWKKAEAVCVTEEQSRAFLEALAPAHRLRLLSLVAMEHVAKAYHLEEASRRPALLHAKQVEALVSECDSGGHPGTFPVDPVMAVRCLNLDKYRSIKVFTSVSADSAVNNLSVLAGGIALAAHALAASGAELPFSGSSADAEDAGGSGGSSGGGDGAAGGSSSEAGDGPEARRQLQQEVTEFLRFLADTHRQYVSGEKRERALEMSRASLLELLHAQAAITALA